MSARTKPAEEVVEEFTCDFGNGTACTIWVKRDMLLFGKGHVVGCKWFGREPDTRIFPMYKEWVHGINRQLASEMGISFKYAFATPFGEAEVWRYKPGQSPECIGTMRGQ